MSMAATMNLYSFHKIDNASHLNKQLSLSLAIKINSHIYLCHYNSLSCLPIWYDKIAKHRPHMSIKVVGYTYPFAQFYYVTRVCLRR